VNAPATTTPPKAPLTAPDFTAPLDVDRVVAQVPQTALIKGFFIDSFEKLILKERPELKGKLYEGLARNSYSPLKTYWRGEIMRAEAQFSTLAYPDVATREALRRSGRLIYPSFLGSLIGRVVLVALFAGDVDAVLKAGPKMFSAMTNFGKVDAVRMGERHWQYRYNDYYSWLDSGDVGVIEGLLMHYGMEPNITVASDGPFDVCMDIQWSPKSA
jgi:uncharacterized protein (TIGR02265 family)